jgi:hypothetical protein
MKRGFLLAVAAAAAAWGCRARPAQPPSLPEAIPSWTSGPLTTGEGWVRRTYARGSTRVNVTLARFAMSAAQYDEWVRTSVAGYPQAALDVPPGSANGFYQCAEASEDRCALLIQLRAGAHLEVRGEGTARRQDVDAIARALPLRALAQLDR